MIYLLLSIIIFGYMKSTMSESSQLRINAVSSISRVSYGAVLQYEFLASNCILNSFTDTIVNNYIGGLASSSSQKLVCLTSNGISGLSNSLISKRNISSLINNTLKISSSITLELWLQPNLTNSFDSIILSIGSKIASTATSSGCNYNLQIANSQNISGFTINVCNQNGASTGNILTASTTFQISDSRYKTIHFVVVITFTTTKMSKSSIQQISTNFTINGVNLDSNYQSFVTSGSGYNPSNWNPSYYLSINPFSRSADSWGGNIYLFALYNRELKYEEIRKNYLASIPNSLPVSLNTSVTVQENGEIGDHSKDPQFYQTAIANNEVSIINIPAFDADDKKYNPNYNPVLGPTMKVYLLTTLNKTSGTIYSLDGSNPVKTSINFNGLRSVYQIPYSVYLRSYAFRFRPPYNVYSVPSSQVIAQFSFVAQDGVTGLFSSSKGVISVSVVHVNKPPNVYPTSHIFVMSKTYSTITLNWVDFDSAIVKAVITKFPKFGSLHRVYQNGTIDHRKLVLNNSQYTIYSYPNSKFQIGYYYSGISKSSPTTSSGAMDLFSYKFYDASDRFSTVANYTISINSSIKVIVMANDPLLQQQSLKNITIFGIDLSDARRSLRMKITRTPLYGSLYHNNGRKVLKYDILEDIIGSGMYTESISVGYKGIDYYFSFPKLNWNGSLINLVDDSFQYYLLSDDGEVSNNMKKIVVVQNVNDPTNITFVPPKGWSSTIYAIGATSSLSQYSTSLLFSGFSLIDKDLGVDLIKVQIHTSKNGRLSLNKKYINQLDFNSNEYCFGPTSWQCQGDGISNSNMIFIAAPSVVESVINGMTYESLTQNIVDNVTIVLYDGVGGECLTNSQLGAGSIRTVCYINSYSIQVTVLGYSGFETTNSFQNSSSGYTRLQYVGIGLLICISLIVLRCLYLRCYKKKKDDKEQVDQKTSWCCLLFGWRKTLTREINYENMQYIVKQLKRKKTEENNYNRSTRGDLQFDYQNNNNNINNISNNNSNNNIDYNDSPFGPTEFYYPVVDNNISYSTRNESNKRFKAVNRSDYDTSTQQYFHNNINRKYLTNNFEHFNTEPYNQSRSFQAHSNKYKNRYNTAVSNKSLKSSRKKKQRDTFSNEEEY